MLTLRTMTWRIMRRCATWTPPTWLCWTRTDRACLDDVGALSRSRPTHGDGSQSGCCTSTLNRLQERSSWKASSLRRAEPKPRLSSGAGAGFERDLDAFDADASSGCRRHRHGVRRPSRLRLHLVGEPDDEAALAGIAERLRAHGKTERFGVRLIRNPLGLNEDEVLLETCDLAHRTLYCSVGASVTASTRHHCRTSRQRKPSPSKTGPKVKQYARLVPDATEWRTTIRRAIAIPD